MVLVVLSALATSLHATCGGRLVCAGARGGGGALALAIREKVPERNSCGGVTTPTRSGCGKFSLLLVVSRHMEIRRPRRGHVCGEAQPRAHLRSFRELKSNQLGNPSLRNRGPRFPNALLCCAKQDYLSGPVCSLHLEPDNENARTSCRVPTETFRGHHTRSPATVYTRHTMQHFTFRNTRNSPRR